MSSPTPPRRPSPTTIDLLRRRIEDPTFRANFTAKLTTTPDRDCLWWTGAISGRGHGRVFLGRDHTGRPHAIIAHRLAYALEHGVDALLNAPVLGHRCDNPLCQRVGAGHVSISSASGNRREYFARRILAGTLLDAPNGSLHQARTTRARLRAHQLADPPPLHQPTLWDTPAGTPGSRSPR